MCLGLFIISLAMVSLWADFFNRPTENADAAIRPFGLESATVVATTTPTYKAAGSASTTKDVFNMDQIANVDLRFMAYSTSTPTTLSYAYFVTSSIASSSQNWSLVAYGNTSMPTSTTIVYPFKSIPLSSLATKILRIEWTVSGAAADTALEVVKDPK